MKRSQLERLLLKEEDYGERITIEYRRFEDVELWAVVFDGIFQIAVSVFDFEMEYVAHWAKVKLCVHPIKEIECPFDDFHRWWNEVKDDCPEYSENETTAYVFDRTGYRVTDAKSIAEGIEALGGPMGAMLFAKRYSSMCKLSLE